MNAPQVSRVVQFKFWMQEEINIYQKCLLKYDCGKYAIILRKKHIIGKKKQQLHLKLRTMIG